MLLRKEMKSGDKKAGRKKEFDTEGFGWLQIRLPKELGEALRRYCFEKNRKKARVLLEALEEKMEKAGLVRVIVTRDEQGREVRSYEVLSK
jgi:hypothetical protein